MALGVPRLNLSIPAAGVTNAMLQHNSITVAPGIGLTGGGAVALGGGAVMLNNTGVLSVTGSSNIKVTSCQNATVSITGVIPSANLPSDGAYDDQPNTFSAARAGGGDTAQRDMFGGECDAAMVAGSGGPAAVHLPSGPRARMR